MPGQSSVNYNSDLVSSAFKKAIILHCISHVLLLLER